MTNAASKPTDIRPPFTLETALAKVQAAENAWNSRDPERIAMAYTESSEWRNRSEFVNGREEIKAFSYGQAAARATLYFLIVLAVVWAFVTATRERET